MTSLEDKSQSASSWGGFAPARRRHFSGNKTAAVSNRRVPFSFISKTTFALPSCISISKRPVSPGSRLATCDRTQVTRPGSCIHELRCQSKHEGPPLPWLLSRPGPYLGVSGLTTACFVPLVGAPGLEGNRDIPDPSLAPPRPPGGTALESGRHPMRSTSETDLGDNLETA